MADIEQRLTRIEKKLDMISNALIELARIEERMAQNKDEHIRIWKNLEDHDNRITTLERETDSNTFITRRHERVYWIIVTAVIGVLAFWLRGAF